MKTALRRILSAVLALSIIVTVSGAGVLIALAADESGLVLGAPSAFTYDGQPKVYDGKVTFNNGDISGYTVQYGLTGDGEFDNNPPVDAGTYAVKVTYTAGDPQAEYSAETTMTISAAPSSPATVTDRYAVVGYHTSLSQIALPDPWVWSASGTSLAGQPTPEIATFPAADKNHLDATQDVTIRYVSFPLASGYADGDLLTFQKRSAAYDLSGIVTSVNGGGTTYSISWASDDNSVMSVRGTALYANGAGLAKLSATVTVTEVNGAAVNIVAARYSFLVLVQGGYTVNTASGLSSIINSGSGVYEITSGNSERIFAAAYAVENLRSSQQAAMKASAMDRLSTLLYGVTKNDIDTNVRTTYDSGLTSREKLYVDSVYWLLPAAEVDGEGDPDNIEVLVEQYKPKDDADVSFDITLKSNVSGRMRAIAPATSMAFELVMPSDYKYSRHDELVLYWDGGHELLDFDYDEAYNTISFRTEALGRFELGYDQSSSSGSGTSSGSTSSDISVGTVIKVDPPAPSKPEVNYNTGGPGSADTIQSPAAQPPAQQPSAAETTDQAQSSAQTETISPSSGSSEKAPTAQKEPPAAVIEEGPETSQITVITAEDIKSAAAENRELILAAVVAAFVSAIVSGSILCVGSMRARKHSVSLAML